MGTSGCFPGGKAARAWCSVKTQGQFYLFTSGGEEKNPFFFLAGIEPLHKIFLSVFVGKLWMIIAFNFKFNIRGQNVTEIEEIETNIPKGETHLGGLELLPFRMQTQIKTV
jgi:hypothetical protein